MNNKSLFAVIFIPLLYAGVTLADGDPDRGRELSIICQDCHGADGMGDEDIPKLAGLEEAYIVEQLQAFASGQRVDEQELMGMIVEDLSEQDMADLAAYFTTLN